MDAHQQWWQQYYGTTTPTAGYGPLTNAVRHHYQHPYHQHHQHHANIPADPTTPSPAPPATFPPEPLPPPAASHHPTPPQLGVVPPNIPNLPDTWTPSDTHLDTNTVHGHTLFRTIQPTQWSRKYNLAGQQVLDIFPWQLSRFGLQDHSLRILSQGRYTGIVTTRSIAEAVFTSQLLPEMRAHNPAPTAITTTTILNPTTQTLHDNSPANYAAAGIQKWLKTLPPATQTQVTNIQQILRDEHITKEQLQEAATRYGIPLARVLKLPPRSLQQLVAAGSALAA